MKKGIWDLCAEGTRTAAQRRQQGMKLTILPVPRSIAALVRADVRYGPGQTACVADEAHDRQNGQGDAIDCA